MRKPGLGVVGNSLLCDVRLLVLCPGSDEKLSYSALKMRLTNFERYSKLCLYPAIFVHESMSLAAFESLFELEVIMILMEETNANKSHISRILKYF